MAEPVKSNFKSETYIVLAPSITLPEEGKSKTYRADAEVKSTEENIGTLEYYVSNGSVELAKSSRG